MKPTLDIFLPLFELAQDIIAYKATELKLRGREKFCPSTHSNVAFW